MGGRTELPLRASRSSFGCMYCDNRLKTPALLANDNRGFKDMEPFDSFRQIAWNDNDSSRGNRQSRGHDYDSWLEQYRMWVLEFDRVDEELSDAQAAPVLDPNLLSLTVRHRALQVVLLDIRGILRNLDPDRFRSEIEADDVPSAELDSSDSDFDPTEYGS